MGLLKAELAKKRQRLEEDTGGKRFFKRSEIEQKQIQKLREQEKCELEAKAQRQAAASNSASASGSSVAKSNSNSAAASSSDTTSSNTVASESLTDEQNIDKINPLKQEVVRRLWFLKQPITLFGDDDDARLDQLKYMLKAGLFEVDSDITKGRMNDFLRDIAELRKRQKSGLVSKRQKTEVDGGVEDGEGGVQ